MMMAPFKLLFSSYALSGLVAIGLTEQGASMLGPLLVFWLGGAATVFALALTPGLRNAFWNEAPERAAIMADGEVAAALAELERDRAEDVASAAKHAVG